MNQQKKKKKKINNYLKYSALFFEMAVIIGGGSYLGYYIDDCREKDFPLYTIILSLFSVFAALYLVFKQILNEK